jgi:subtilase family serine protease
MKARSRSWARLALLVGAFAAAAVVAWTASAPAPAAASYFRPGDLPSMPLGPLGAFAQMSADAPPVCPAPTNFPCYAPVHIRQAYDYPSGDRAPTGAGQTIVIVDPYATEYASVTGTSIDADLAAFDAAFGVPAPPGGAVTIEPGPPSTCTAVGVDCSGDPSLWVLEIALDVEWAHAMAPGARIVLLSPSSDSSTDVAAAEQAVLPGYPGAIVSQSFGGPESASDPDQAALHQVYADVIQGGGTVLAGSGDYGATDLTQFYGAPQIVANYPASDPLVLAVGGTQGHPFPFGLWVAPTGQGGDHSRGHGRGDGRGRSYYGGEEVWNEPALGPVASGGAPSVVWHTPPWQLGLTSYQGRTVPDVAYNAAVEGGVLTVAGGGLWIMGGTSAGPPQWAAIVALANELRGQRGGPSLGLAALPLYMLARNPRTYRSDFHDVTFGNNAAGSGNAPADPALGFDAGPGYDLATGWGTPDVSNLLQDLARSPRGGLLHGDYGGPRGGRGHGHDRFEPGR